MLYRHLFLETDVETDVIKTQQGKLRDGCNTQRMTEVGQTYEMTIKLPSKLRKRQGVEMPRAATAKDASQSCGSFSQKGRKTGAEKWAPMLRQ